MEHGVYQQYYDLEQHHWWFAGMRAICQSVLKRISGLSPETSLCLDVGCGTGLWTKQLESFGTTWGLDVSEEALKFCRERGIHRVILAPGEEIPFSDRHFDIITSLGVIEHVTDHERFAAELHRVCKPGGYALLLTSAFPMLWSQHDDIVHHKRRYRKRGFEAVLQTAGFNIVKCSYVNAVLFPMLLPLRLLQRVLTTKPLLVGQTTSDVFMPPAFLNRLLYQLLVWEARCLPHIDLPVGVGLVALVQRPAESCA